MQGCWWQSRGPNNSAEGRRQSWASSRPSRPLCPTSPKPCLQQTVFPVKTALPVLPVLPPETDPRYFLQVLTSIGIKSIIHSRSCPHSEFHCFYFNQPKKSVWWCRVNQNAMFVDVRWTDAVEVWRNLSPSEVK